MFGVEYLLAQQGQQLCVSTEELNKEINEGFEDIEDIETQEEPVQTLCSSQQTQRVRAKKRRKR
jgi:hypothetical protein